MVGLVGGFREVGANGTPEEPSGFRRKLRVWRVLRYSGLVIRSWMRVPEEGNCRLTYRELAVKLAAWWKEPLHEL
jgi:hypothetical protein